MICYRDMTFCSAGDRCATPDCGRRFTTDEREKARKWWGSDADGEGPPVAFADFSGRLCFTPALRETARTGGFALTKRAEIPQAEWTRAIRGALKAGLPVGTFKVTVENGHLVILPLSANDPADAAQDMERRMQEAFGE